MIRRLAGSLTLIAGVMLLLGLPLVIGAASTLGTARFTGLMVAALIACCSAIVLTSVAQYLVAQSRAPEQPSRTQGARASGRDR